MNKSLHLICLTMLVLCGIALLYIAGTLIEAPIDTHICKKEFLSLYHAEKVDAYANGDIHYFNFGRNIQCRVFWYEPDNEGKTRLTHIDFTNGELTLEKIKSKRYWLCDIFRDDFLTCWRGSMED